MFGSEPSWDVSQERQAIGRVHRSPDDDESARVADELKRAAAAAILTEPTGRQLAATGPE